METKKIVISGLAGGAVLLVLQLFFSSIVQVVAPYDIFALGGMRAADDPVMALFFAYPFVLAFAAAAVFSVVRSALPGSLVSAGVMFGLLLFLLVTVTSTFVIFTSMTYPVGFHLENLLFGIIGFPVLGILLARVWGPGERAI